MPTTQSDHAEQRVGQRVTEAGVERHDTRRRGGTADHLGQRARRHVLLLALLVLQVDADISSSVDVAVDGRWRSWRSWLVRQVDAGAAAMAAEVDDRRLQLVQVTHHLVDAHRPLRPEVEVVAALGHAQLALDRSAFVIEGKPGRPVRIGGEEQDDMSVRDSLRSSHLRRPDRG